MGFDEKEEGSVGLLRKRLVPIERLKVCTEAFSLEEDGLRYETWLNERTMPRRIVPGKRLWRWKIKSFESIGSSKTRHCYTLKRVCEGVGERRE